MDKILQFELWQECNNGCKFCYLGYQKESAKEKIKSIDFTLEKISNLDLYTKQGYNIISFIGGEFFQGQMKDPAVYSKFMELIDKTIWLYDNGYIYAIWLMLTLTSKVNNQLIEVLDKLKGRRVWIATSYDTKGRFHNSGQSNWIESMDYIKSNYPGFRFNITSILTKDLITRYLNSEFSFKYFINRYNCEFFLKQCGVPGSYENKEECNKHLPWFFPTRSEFLKFLVKFKREESDLMWDKLFNIHYRADTLYRYELNGLIPDQRNKDEDRIISIDCTENYDIASCGHLKSYQGYSDCDACVLCDKFSISD